MGPIMRRGEDHKEQTNLLETIPQRKLLDTRLCQPRPIHPEFAARRLVLQRRQRIDIKAHGVSHIENLPSELERLLPVNLPRFRQPGINTEVSISAEGIAAPRFTRQRI